MIKTKPLKCSEDADTSDFFFPKMSNEPFYLVWTDSIGQYSSLSKR